MGFLPGQSLAWEPSWSTQKQPCLRAELGAWPGGELGAWQQPEKEKLHFQLVKYFFEGSKDDMPFYRL